MTVVVVVTAEPETVAAPDETAAAPLSQASA
jgi:hypothetical protein